MQMPARVTPGPKGGSAAPSTPPPLDRLFIFLTVVAPHPLASAFAAANGMQNPPWCGSQLSTLNPSDRRLRRASVSAVHFW